VPSAWLQLTLKAPPAALDTISNFLIERGSTGVVLKEREVLAFFPLAATSSTLKKEVQGFLRAIREVYPRIQRTPQAWTVLRNRNWHDAWRRYFSPQKIGKRFWITPPWVHPPESERRDVIVIEPGMAFGTGTHFTTRSCLEFIEEAVSRLKLSDFQALDVGTGSGILAIALAKLGARRVFALDHDPVAIRVAKKNVERNRVKAVVKLLNSRLEALDGTFKIIVANLTAETIVDLAAELKDRLAPGGYIILAGILGPKVAQVLAQFTSTSMVLLRRKHKEEWTTLLLKKNG
jgi:ribosomal protein L11 methyltransferase